MKMRRISLSRHFLYFPFFILNFTLFNVLNLFSYFLNLAFYLQRMFFYSHVVRLGRDRICFAVELLRKEVEPLADLFGVVHYRTEMLKVRAEPCDLLRYV